MAASGERFNPALVCLPQDAIFQINVFVGKHIHTLKVNTEQPIDIARRSTTEVSHVLKLHEVQDSECLLLWCQKPPQFKKDRLDRSSAQGDRAEPRSTSRSLYGRRLLHTGGAGKQQSDGEAMKALYQMTSSGSPGGLNETYEQMKPFLRMARQNVGDQSWEI